MKMLTTFVAVIAASVSTTACKGKSKTGSEATGSGSAAAPVPIVTDASLVPTIPPGGLGTVSDQDWRKAIIPNNMPSAFTSWDLTARVDAWQGAWLTQPGIGFFVAIDVVGNKVTSWDGKADKTLWLQIESPCSARLIEKSSAGESSTTTHYTLKDGKLLSGLGDAGARRGKAAIACVSNAILVLDESGKCSEWSVGFGEYKEAVGTCALQTKGDKQQFTATVNGMKVALTVDGDAIYSDQLGQKPDQHFGDFAAAKAARQ
jgi:hypothetical protein